MKRGHRCPGVRRKVVAIKGVDRHAGDTTCVIGIWGRQGRNRCPAIGDADRHCRSVRPGVGSYVVDRDRALRSGVATEIVDLVVESHVFSRLRCGQRRAGAPSIGGDIVDGVLGNMRADVAAGNIDFPVPVGALDVGLAGRHVCQLCPGLRCGSPAPEVIEVLRGGVGAAVDVNVRAIAASTGAVASRRTSGGGSPRARRAAATTRKHRH